MEYKTFQIQEILEFQPKSRHKAGEGLMVGTYPFFTSSQIQRKWFDTADYVTDSVILGTGGAPSVHYAKAFSTSTDVFILCPRNNKISAEYVYFYLLKNICLLERGFKGAGLKHISSEYVKKLPVTLPIDNKGNPDLKEQGRIIALLREVDGLKKKRAMADKKMTETIPALFNMMFGDLKSNDKKWSIVRFGEIGTARLGKMLDAKKQTGKNKLPYIKNTNVKWGYFDLHNLPEMDFSESEQEQLRLRFGDLLICEGGEIGRAAIWRDGIHECYFQKALHRVRLDPEKATPEFVVSLLSRIAENDGFREYIGTATIAHLTGVELASLKIPLPPITLQKEFTQKVKTIEDISKVQKESHIKIEQLTSSVMSRVFSMSDL